MSDQEQAVSLANLARGGAMAEIRSYLAAMLPEGTVILA